MSYNELKELIVLIDKEIQEVYTKGDSDAS